MRNIPHISVGITATGQYHPEQIITNTDLAKTLDTSEEWILSRTGIQNRHWTQPGTGSSELGVKALKIALENRQILPNELDAIIVATSTPDMLFPCTASLIQNKIGANNAYGFDINAACSGFLFALTTGAKLIDGNHIKRIAVIGCDVMTSVINKNDRNTAILFGDGAGAVILEKVDDGYGIIDFIHKTDGSGANLLSTPSGGSANPITIETILKNEHFIQQNGKEVYKRAVQEMTTASHSLLMRNNLTANDISLVVPHQANLRIIDAIAKRLNLPMNKIAINIREYANTTAATIPTALHTYLTYNKLNHGDIVLLTAFGAGFTWGSALLKWTIK